MVLCCLHGAGPALFSYERGVPVQSAAVRTHAESVAGRFLTDQLRAHRAVRIVLRTDKRAISKIQLVGVGLGSADYNCNGRYISCIYTLSSLGLHWKTIVIQGK